MQLSVCDERDIEELIAEGNDPVATRLVYELLDLPQEQVRERTHRLFELGDRYLDLALECRLCQISSLPVSSQEQDERVATWHQEAESLYVTAIASCIQAVLAGGSRCRFIVTVLGRVLFMARLNLCWLASLIR